MRALRRASVRETDRHAESWEQKSKFPPNLKPLLAALSLQAITLDEYDDNFFSLMPIIFPYNKFTMSVSCNFDSFAVDIDTVSRNL